MVIWWRELSRQVSQYLLHTHIESKFGTFLSAEYPYRYLGRNGLKYRRHTFYKAHLVFCTYSLFFTVG